jgi:hypothetical protein
VNEIKSCVSTDRSPSGTAFHEHFSLSDLSKSLLFLHSRFSNLPLELIAPLFRNMAHDLDWVQSSNSNSAATVTTTAQFAGVESILLICPGTLSEGSKQKIPTGGCIDVAGSSALLFNNFEDETFFEESTAAVLYQSQGIKMPMVAMLFPLSKLAKCVQTLHDMLPQQISVDEKNQAENSSSSSSSKA